MMLAETIVTVPLVGVPLAGVPSPVPFWIAFCATLVLMTGALITGFRGVRRLHLVLGPATMVALLVAIVLTEQMASRYEFPEEELWWHLLFAEAAALLALPVIGTGIWYWRRPQVRRWHVISVFAWIAVTLVATATGFWMFSNGTLR